MVLRKQTKNQGIEISLSPNAQTTNQDMTRGGSSAKKVTPYKFGKNGIRSDTDEQNSFLQIVSF